MFITFEGGEGSGKSTQSKLLCDALSARNIQTTHTREPGGTAEADAIRELLVKGDPDKWDGVAETLLHYAARRHHVEHIIKPALKEGQVVVCDRFTDSTFAYQGAGHGIDVSDVHAFTVGDFKPTLTFICDIKPEIGLRRTEGRTHDEDRYEQMDIAFHTRLREAFLSIAHKEPSRCVVIDASLPQEEIQQLIKNAVKERLAIPL